MFGPKRRRHRATVSAMAKTVGAESVQAAGALCLTAACGPGMAVGRDILSTFQHALTTSASVSSGEIRERLLERNPLRLFLFLALGPDPLDQPCASFTTGALPQPEKLTIAEAWRNCLFLLKVALPRWTNYQVMHVVTLVFLSLSQGYLTIVSTHAATDTVYHSLVSMQMKSVFVAVTKLLFALSTGSLIQRIQNNVRGLIERRLWINMSEYIEKRYLRDELVLRTLDYGGPTTEVSYAHDDIRQWSSSCASFLLLALKVFPGTAFVLATVLRRIGFRPMLVMAVAMRLAMLLGKIVGGIGRGAVLSRWPPMVGRIASLGIRAGVALATTVAGNLTVPLLLGRYFDRLEARAGGVAGMAALGGYEGHLAAAKAASIIALTCGQLSASLSFLTRMPAPVVSKAMLFNCKLYQREKLINDIRRRVVRQTRSHINGTINDLDYISVQSIAVLEEPYQPRTSRALLHHLSFHVKPGNNTLIMGPQGCGKTSILRLIGEFLPLHEGGISKPPNPTSLLYISNNIFVPRWSLKRHLTHPHVQLGTKCSASNVGENELMHLLEVVGLGDVFDRYACLDDWDLPLEEIGEAFTREDTQRLGMARVLLHRPLFALLDEATDMVPAEDEAAFFAACAERHITCLTVSNRTRIWPHHTFGLVIGSRGDSRRPGGFTGSLTPSKNSSFTATSPPSSSRKIATPESFSYFFGPMAVVVGSGSQSPRRAHSDALLGAPLEMSVSSSSCLSPPLSSRGRQGSVPGTPVNAQLHFPRIINAKDARRIGTSATITQSHYCTK